MNSIIRVVTAVNKVSVANPDICRENIEEIISKVREKKPDIITFPSYALCSVSSGSLIENPYLADICEEQLSLICSLTQNLKTYIIVGLIININHRPITVNAVLYEGKILGYVPLIKDIDKFTNLFGEKFLHPNTLFNCGGINFSICGTDLDNLMIDIPENAKVGADLIIIPSYSPVVAGKVNTAIDTIKVISSQLGIGVAIANGGIGDTSSPYLYNGFSAIIECGNTLVYQRANQDNLYNICDVDVDIIRSGKKYRAIDIPKYEYSIGYTKKGLLRNVPKNPFVPQGKFYANKYLQDLFNLQQMSLVSRLSNTNIDKVVIGISGGLDSTLALLVCVKALDTLKLPRENIICVTMEGFGTSSRTYNNAVSLINHFGCTHLNIPITNAVTNHLNDIEHDIKLKDVTYENAQARERTQILFDIGNKYGGLVVGTGDLSESALGWCTFNGDHMANYNVNASIPKSVIRLLVKHVVKSYLDDDVEQILDDILQTPISPELIPSIDNTDEIEQKTEDILGPYDLHDFFLYYIVKYKFRPDKLFYYACISFAGELEPSFIKEKLKLFLLRFFKSQFKRSCSPDSAILTDVSLNSEVFYIPSDCSADTWLKHIEQIKFE